MISWADIPRAPEVRTLRQFSGLCLLLFGGAAAWRWWSGSTDLRTIALAIGGATGVVGLVRPRFVRPVFVVWLMLSFPIGWAVSRLILAVLFYGVFTPIGVVFRMMGRDVLKLRPDRRSDSYWTPKDQSSGRSYYRQF